MRDKRKQLVREVEVNSDPNVGNRCGYRAVGKQKDEDRKKISRCSEQKWKPYGAEAKKLVTITVTWHELKATA